MYGAKIRGRMCFRSFHSRVISGVFGFDCFWRHIRGIDENIFRMLARHVRRRTFRLGALCGCRGMFKLLGSCKDLSNANCGCFAIRGDVGDDGALGWVSESGFGCFVAVDPGIDSHRFEDGIHAWFCVIDAFDHALERWIEIFFALAKKIQRAAMTINNGAVAEVEIVNDVLRAAPAEDVVVNIFASRMLADFAESFVAGAG